MQIAVNTPSTHSGNFDVAIGNGVTSQPASMPLNHYQIIRRNGAVVPFEPDKIAVAMMKAFLAVHGTQGAASASVREVVDSLTQGVVRALMRSRPGGGTFHIEDVQDQVELGLMRGGHHEIARAYVLYRERRTQERARQAATEAAPTPAPTLHVTDGGSAGRAGSGPAQGTDRISLQRTRLPTSSPDPSLRRPCATCTTASRWTRSTRPPSWRHAP